MLGTSINNGSDHDGDEEDDDGDDDQAFQKSPPRARPAPVAQRGTAQGTKPTPEQNYTAEFSPSAGHIY